MNVCTFCGPTDRILTEEHIWPEWVSKMLRHPGYNVDHFRHLESVSDSTNGNWTGRYIDMTTKTLCDRCNNRWLSAFENDRVKPLAGPMLMGDPFFTILPEGQHLLAAWAYKMALLLDVRMPHVEHGEFFTGAERLLFRQTTAAHPFVRVFLAQYNYGHHPAHCIIPAHEFTERDGLKRTFYLKISTITAGRLGMQVMAVRSAETMELVPASEMAFAFEGTAADSILPIWPVEPRLVGWPPRFMMNAHDLEDWTSMWIKSVSPDPPAS